MTKHVVVYRNPDYLTLGALRTAEQAAEVANEAANQAAADAATALSVANGVDGKADQAMADAQSAKIAFTTRAAMIAAMPEIESVDAGRVIYAGGVAYERDPSSSAIPDMPGWKPSGDVTPQHFGAAADGVADDTASVAGSVQLAAETGVVGLPDGVFVTYRDDPSSGGTSPQDWALNPNSAEWIKGLGVQSVLASQVPNNNIIMRYGLLPIGDREPDIVGGGIEGVTFDGGFDASDPVVADTWDIQSPSNVWLSGIRDVTLRNVSSVNSAGYGFALQNGRHQRLRVRDVVTENTARDGIDLKNNYNRGRDNSFLGVWIERFGRVEADAVMAGLDLHAQRNVMSHVWVTDWGDKGLTDAGVRFKAGEDGDARGMGGFRNVLTGFHVDINNSPRASMGVDVRHREAVVSSGTINNANHAGVRFQQERGLAVGLHITGDGRGNDGFGIFTRVGGEVTGPDDIVTSALSIQETWFGLRLDGDRSINIGHSLRNNNKSVRLEGDQNVVLAASSGTSGVPVVDNGSDNWVGLWEAGTLNVYRGGARAYSFGDNIMLSDLVPLRLSNTKDIRLRYNPNNDRMEFMLGGVPKAHLRMDSEKNTRIDLDDGVFLADMAPLRLSDTQDIRIRFNPANSRIEFTVGGAVKAYLDMTSETTTPLN